MIPNDIFRGFVQSPLLRFDIPILMIHPLPFRWFSLGIIHLLLATEVYSLFSGAW